MKMKMNWILFAATCITLHSCSGGFSKGVKKDLTTGLTSSYNGFAVENIYLSIDGKKLTSNSITLGKEVALIAEGVDSYQEKDGKVYPGCRIILTDKAGKELINQPDAFAEYTNGLEKDKASLLTATLNTGSPMQVGETYHLSVRFFDKNKKESEIVSNADLMMKE